MNGAELCRAGRSILEEAGMYNPNELNSLFRAATGRDRYDMQFSPVSAEEEERFLGLLKRRTAGEPLQYLCGEWPFLDFSVRVDRRALIPRPETELLAGRAIEMLQGKEPGRILDLCSGTGVLAIALKRAFPSAEVTAVELSADACSLMSENARLNGAGIVIRQADACEYVKDPLNGPFSLIVCNPPYVTPADYDSNYDELRYEPRMAFIGGDDGLFFYRSLIPFFPSLLEKSGSVALEIGNEQGPAVKKLLEENGFQDIRVSRDFGGLDRDVTASVQTVEISL